MLRSLIIKDHYSVLHVRMYATKVRGSRKQGLNNQAALADYAHLVGTDTTLKLRCHFTRGRTVHKETFGYFVKDMITQGHVLYERTVGCFLDDMIAHLRGLVDNPRHKCKTLLPATTASHVVYNIMMRFCIGLLFASGFILMLTMVFGFLVMCMWLAENFPSVIIAMAVIAFCTCLGWFAI
jgi:hypothetical protein